MRAAVFQPKAISNVAAALAKLTHHCPELLSTLLAAAKPNIIAFNTQELTNLLHSLAVPEPSTHRTFFQELQPLLLSRLGALNEQHRGRKHGVGVRCRARR